MRDNLTPQVTTTETQVIDTVDIDLSTRLCVAREPLHVSLQLTVSQYLDTDWRVKREKVEEEVEVIDWSKGLGKGADIPEYLWWKKVRCCHKIFGAKMFVRLDSRSCVSDPVKGAAIRLRNLGKRDTELFIKEVQSRAVAT